MTEQNSTSSSAVSTGVGVGAVMAAVLSWSVSQSAGYMFLHTLCGWLYVIYWAFTY
jgi:hypothetical protein